MENKIVLGRIPEGLTGISGFDNTYGLYADNVYLKGSLVIEDTINNNIYSAGVSTSGINKTPNGENRIFWSGLKDNPNFSVDINGTLTAKNGYFSGTIEASTLRAVKIIGIGDSINDGYGLTIEGQKGLLFKGSEEPEQDSLKEFSTFRLESKGAIFSDIITSWRTHRKDPENKDIEKIFFEIYNTDLVG